MRITKYNLKKYLDDTYGNRQVQPCSHKQLDGFIPLLQNDYGEANDCTLTSMTAIIFYLSEQKLAVKDIYPVVEKFAKKYGYRGNRGTPFATIRMIFQKSLANFKMPTAYGKYLRGIGYKFKDIKAEINKGNPVILSLDHDGKDYYDNHSITIVGYELYKINNKDVPMLIVYDNWYKAIAYVDYNKMSRFSSIHFAELTFKQRHNMWKTLKNLK